MYNTDGYLTQILRGDNQESIWTRGTEYASGLPENETLGLNISCDYVYNDYNQLQDISMGNVFHYTFGYDQTTGNLMHRSNIIDPINNQRVEHFTYDPLHRLSTTRKNDNNFFSLEMTYGADGNILTKSDIGSYSYDVDRPHAISSIADPLVTPPHQIIHYTPFNKAFSINQGDDSQQYQLDITYGADEQRSMTELTNITNNGPEKVYKRYFDGDYEREITYGSPNITKQFYYIHAGGRLIAIGIKTENQQFPDMHYICSDNQGSIMGLMNKTGTMEEEYSYDAWGNRRDPLTWNTTTSIPTYIIYRGYTGHEHLDEFNLINMNGRIYDPAIGRFFSPDNFVQSPDFTQSINRYTYCLNNPLKYTDPSGDFYILDDFAIGFVKGCFNGENPFKSGYTQAENCVKIFGGLFVGKPKQILSRFTWEYPQTLLGYCASQTQNTIGDVRSVSYYEGATVLTGNSHGLFYGLGGLGMTLGSYILGNNEMKADPNNWLFQHEYGHYLQSQAVGWAYLPGYALPSLWGDPSNDPYQHDYNPIEQDANVRSIKYFHNKIGDKLIWHFNKNPIGYPGTGWNNIPEYYNNPKFQSLLKRLIVNPSWDDYASWLMISGPIFSGWYHSQYYRTHFIDYE